MLTVHHLGISQSERIIWLCEELGIPYELKIYKRAETGMGPPEYKALHPQGTAPIITDGDVVLPESGAIIEYILAKYGNGRLQVRSGASNFADYLYWFHYSNATFMTTLMTDFTALRLGADPSKQALGVRTETGYRMIEKRLGEVPYFAGSELTAADIMMVFPLTTLRAFTHRDLSNAPNTRAYLKRIGERPAYRRAMEKGDPGMPLKLE